MGCPYGYQTLFDECTHALSERHDVNCFCGHGCCSDRDVCSLCGAAWIGQRWVSRNRAKIEGDKLLALERSLKSWVCISWILQKSTVKSLQDVADAMTMQGLRAEIFSFLKDQPVKSTPTSGDGSVENVGFVTEGKFSCPACRQQFSSERASQIHYRFVHAASDT
mmetsp:Transcript_135473/g.235587  ORF Transcript_135473/g.235587 Transcript_135473/m.235587 type:complete len:165 (-) Transcript_135473:29-523(-)